MHGFGPVVPEPNEPVFHADWEKKIFALNIGIGAAGHLESRHLRASCAKASRRRQYLNISYYEICAGGVAASADAELWRCDTRDEIEAGHAIGPAKKAQRPVSAEQRAQ